jgi:hypothetical protein
MAFDGILYGFHQAHANELPALVQHINLGPMGFSFQIPL